MEKPIIEVNEIKKRYRLGSWGFQSFIEGITGKNILKRDSGERRQGKIFMALNGVSFDVMAGEKVAIIGKNGAGKSTLLKIISRITYPTRGSLTLRGKVSSLLEVGTGFHPEMTGRENIYMSGAILGMNKKEIDSKIDRIIDFSEVGDFVDIPVKRYSSGMYLKLAFSVSAYLDNEIIIMDEVLRVGDADFQEKCIAKMQEMVRVDNKTILFVSHNVENLRELCDRGIVLDEGKIVYDGPLGYAIERYSNTLDD